MAARYCTNLMRTLLFATLLLASCRPPATEIDVSAAISLQDALTEIGRGYEQQSGTHVVFNFAGSNVLARQIRAGAPVDVFIPADEKTMESVRGYVDNPQPLLSNALVVVSDLPLHTLADLTHCRRIALGDPSAVPAGVYAREVLEQAGLWRAVEPRVVPAENVRAALAAVEGGNVDAAIVYATDARLAKKTRVAFTITPGPRIVYPVAIVRGARHAAAARSFVGYLRSPAGAAVFRKYGFVPM